MITCNNCNWKGHSWECGNWDEDPEHRCQLCEWTRVGGVDVQIHECKECYGPASYRLPYAEEQYQIRLIAQKTVGLSNERGQTVMQMMDNKGWGDNIPMMESIATFIIVSRDADLRFMLPFVEDRLKWLYKHEELLQDEQQELRELELEYAQE